VSEKHSAVWHELKCLPEYFNEILEGRKKFEVRINDRDFRAGDFLVLREYSAQSEEYTGAVVARRVTYILYGGRFGIPEDTCIMSLETV
jgi:glyoxylate utilization-related uncharacterized protein